MSLTPEWMRMMAQYNAWQNGWMIPAASGLTAAEREVDRGAFFKSIHETLSHVLWADCLWMGRFDGGEPHEAPIEAGTKNFPDWDGYVAARDAMDQRITRWAASLSDADLLGDVTFWSGTKGAELVVTKTKTYTHFFNHQTHHRGQVHGMLTAAGVATPDTDLLFMES
jgi:uncharacterized damage-inducible protein DinB